MWRRAFHDDAAAVADRDGAVAGGEGAGQLTAVGGAEPEAEQVTLARGIGPVLELGAIVQDLMIVNQLDIARLERHLEMHARILEDGIERVERLELPGGEARHLRKPLRG